MEINIQFNGVETRFLVDGGVGICEVAKSNPKRFQVSGDIFDEKSLKTDYPYIKGALVLYKGSYQEAQYISDTINQLGGISSHDTYLYLLKELEKRIKMGWI